MVTGTIREYDEESCLTSSCSSTFSQNAVGRRGAGYHRGRGGGGGDMLNSSNTDAGMADMQDFGSGHSWLTDVLGKPGGRCRTDAAASRLPPDLSVCCDACCAHVTLAHLPRHRLYHRCLARLGYGCFSADGRLQVDWQPDRLDELLDRRRELLSALTDQATDKRPLDLTTVRNINDAFEFLKNELEGFQKCPRVSVNYDELFEDLEVGGNDLTGGPLSRPNNTSQPGSNNVSSNVSEKISSDSHNGHQRSRCVLAVGTCQSRNSRWKCDMEDRHTVQSPLVTGRGTTGQGGGATAGSVYAAVFDGYGGGHSAEFASKRLHKALICELSKFDPEVICTCKDPIQHPHTNKPRKPREEHNIEKDIHRLSKDMIQSIIISCERNINTINDTDSQTSEIISRCSSPNGSPRASERTVPSPKYTSSRNQPTLSPTPSHRSSTLSHRSPVPSHPSSAPSQRSTAPSHRSSALSRQSPVLSKNGPAPPYRSPAPSHRNPAPSLHIPSPSELALDLAASSSKSPSPTSSPSSSSSSSLDPHRVVDNGAGFNNSSVVNSATTPRLPLDRRSKRRRMRRAFEAAHRRVDSSLADGEAESSRVRWSGCSTLCALVVDREEEQEAGSEGHGKGDDLPKAGANEGNQGLGEIHISNAGHIQGVLIRAGQFYVLSKDHSTNNDKECSRVTDYGGDMTSVDDSLWNHSPRLNGVLPATRGLGSHGDASLKKYMITTPSFTTVKLDEYAQFLILASSGLWMVLDASQVSNLAVQILQSLRPSSRFGTPQPTPRKTGAPPCDSTTSSELSSTDNILKQIYGSNCDNQGSAASEVTTSSGLDVDHDYSVACHVAETLVKAAIMAGSRDNITVVCLLLAGSKRQ